MCYPLLYHYMEKQYRPVFYIIPMSLSLIFFLMLLYANIILVTWRHVCFTKKSNRLEMVITFLSSDETVKMLDEILC